MSISVKRGEEPVRGRLTGSAAATVSAELPSRRRLRIPHTNGILYVLPAAALYVVFVVFPIIDGAYVSLFSWDGIGPAKWVGLSNYRMALSDPLARASFLHACELVLFYSLIPIVIGLLVASAATRVHVKGIRAIQVIIFIPVVISPVVAGVSWGWLLDVSGPINKILTAVSGLFGLGPVTEPWLGSFNLALPTEGLIGTWATLGLCMVLFISGILQIPQSLYDAASVDGAGFLRQLRAVTLPGLRDQMAVAITITFIGALRTFDLIYVTTLGGPGHQTYVPSLLIYTEAFVSGAAGYAAALAVILTLIIVVAAFAITRLVEVKAHG
jgi:raffinose/stachyose/melibiose transport system permease protein